jgi:hypothetical protein
MAGNELKHHIESAKDPRPTKSLSLLTLWLALGEPLTLLVRVHLIYLLLFLGLPVSALSDSCPSPVYDKCPSDSNEVGVHYVDPWHILVDTVIESGKSSDYVYYWCFKATPSTNNNDEFQLDWQDPPINWNTYTTCGGYAGVRTPSSLAPGPWRDTVI